MSSLSTMSGQENISQIQDEEENTFREFLKFLYEYFEISQKWTEIQRFVNVHPAISVFLIMTIGMCSVPVVFFTVFVISSIALSILGFCLIEGTLITVGSFVLIGVLFLTFMFAFGFSTFLVCGYYTMGRMASIALSFLNKFQFLSFGGESSKQIAVEKEE